MILKKPLLWCSINQWFGEEFYGEAYPHGFYSALGMRGHNGVDLRVSTGKEVFAIHDGVVKFAGGDSGYGINILLQAKDLGTGKFYQTVYGHLCDVVVKAYEAVHAGDIIGHADNTGMSTGAHLHFGLRFMNHDFSVENYNNGYFGWVDPKPYMEKDWLAWPVDLRYNQPRNWNTYLCEVKAVGMLWAGLKRKPTSQEISAYVYGGWLIKFIIRPEMWSYINWMSYSEYLLGKKPYQF